MPQHPLTLTDHVVGRNKISSRQRATYEAFLAYEQHTEFHAAVNALTQDELEAVARHGYSALGPAGKLLDGLFCDAWDGWVATLEVAPPKSHKWIKGVLATAIILSY
jgi:hypothetical protein